MSRTKYILIGVLVLAGIAGAVFGARHLMEPGSGEASPVDKPSIFYTVPEIVTNLADVERRSFIQVGIELELERSDVVKELDQKEAPARDSIIAVLRSKTSEDLSGEDGMRSLGEEIRNQLNGLLSEGGIISIFFTKLIVQ